eukprot:CAMPEP_0170192542 /NCGR_PEP_ID=MMETSP0040_2-20121228/54501_1 /TAXON_ID=641309 /ORGANISM="Lotharella oceanica, Strain CCMP622" /LENGTH=168 /DNA_ID=CAMNT_0010440949 /DNA_START=394 /DNA_END=899 /DNA_ORIENTATION=-
MKCPSPVDLPFHLIEPEAVTALMEVDVGVAPGIPYELWEQPDSQEYKLCFDVVLGESEYPCSHVSERRQGLELPVNVSGINVEVALQDDIHANILERVCRHICLHPRVHPGRPLVVPERYFESKPRAGSLDYEFVRNVPKKVTPKPPGKKVNLIRQLQHVQADVDDSV